MNDNNKTVAKEIIRKLKAEKLIADDVIDLESKIANGAIRENEWKLFFEQQIMNTNKHFKIETE